MRVVEDDWYSRLGLPHAKLMKAASMQRKQEAESLQVGTEKQRKSSGELGFRAGSEGTATRSSKHIVEFGEFQQKTRTADRHGKLPLLELTAYTTPLKPTCNRDHVLAGYSSHTKFRKLASGVAGSTTQVSPSIVVIIIVLTVIFFLSAFLHLLIRWLARNSGPTRRALPAGTVRAGGNSTNRIIALTAIHGQLQHLFSMQDAGLDRSLIDDLPVFSFKAAMAGLKEGADCAICLCEFVVNDELRLLPSCGHAFHTDCIDTWLLSHSTCPLCRTLLIPECWLPGSLEPLLSSEVSTVSDVEHPQLFIDPTALPAHSRRSVGLGSSSRRSSLGRFTLVASTPVHIHLDQGQSHDQLAGEPGVTTPNLVACSVSNGGNSTNEINQIITESGTFDALAEADYGTPHAVKIGFNQAASSVMPRSATCASVAAMSTDSGRLSHTSLVNNTEAQSGRYSGRLERGSPYGSGRRISVHLGKCRAVNEQKGGACKPQATAGDSNRSFQKTSYEYVIDGSANLEFLIPPQSKANTLLSSSRFNDLLNLSRRVQSSLMADEALPGPGTDNLHSMQDLSGSGFSIDMRRSSSSFRISRLCHGEDSVHCTEEGMRAPLNTSRPSDNPDELCQWPAGVFIVENVSEFNSDASMKASFSVDPAPPMHPELDVLRTSNGEIAKRVMSFRLPTPASHHVLNAKLRASGSRRTLSDSGDSPSFLDACIGRRRDD